MKKFLIILFCFIAFSCGSSGGDKNDNENNPPAQKENLVPERPNLVEWRAVDQTAYFKWKPVEGATGYNIYIRWNDHIEAFYVAAEGGTEINIWDFARDIEYYVWITAANEHGEGLMTGYFIFTF